MQFQSMLYVAVMKRQEHLENSCFNSVNIERELTPTQIYYKPFQMKTLTLMQITADLENSHNFANEEQIRE